MSPDVELYVASSYFEIRHFGTEVSKERCYRNVASQKAVIVSYAEDYYEYLRTRGTSGMLWTVTVGAGRDRPLHGYELLLFPNAFCGGLASLCTS
jgi:hypothetical protein